ncbi:hypothetical protein [Rhizobium anhuiense]|uniref:hypothetical protein n=1 Tax=Rhizobium anhuiense TaxID=1184720 RepID=UPI0015CF0A6B|nr:hypothetical protein [Rhizobium anhuiense]
MSVQNLDLVSVGVRDDEEPGEKRAISVEVDDLIGSEVTSHGTEAARALGANERPTTHPAVPKVCFQGNA